MILHKRIQRDRSQEALERLVRVAFTLMEMLIVVAIIVALAGVGGMYLIKALGQSKEKAAKLQAQQIADACTQYYTEMGTMPTSLQQLLTPNNNLGPWLTESAKLLDPWGNQYELNCYDYDRVRGELVDTDAVEAVRYWPREIYVGYRNSTSS